jgi:hypothetical protein
MAGVWVGEEKIYPSQWVLGGAVADARVENRIALGGLILVQDYAQTKDGRALFEGHGVLRWDAAAGQYVMHWFDSMGMPPEEFRGTCTGGVLAMTARSAQGGLTRATWDYSTPGAYTFRMEVQDSAGQWSAMMDGSYTKRS